MVLRHVSKHIKLLPHQFVELHLASNNLSGLEIFAFPKLLIVRIEIVIKWPFSFIMDLAYSPTILVIQPPNTLLLTLDHYDKNCCFCGL